MARLGIVAALAREAHGLGGPVPPVGGRESLSDTVLLAVSGMGAARARLAGEALIAGGATTLVSWGSAAALSPELAPGALLLPHRIVPAEGAEFPADPAWHARLAKLIEAHMAVCTAPLAESPTVLASYAAKRSLYERTGAAAADMESAALGYLARETGTPFLVVRAVADASDVIIPPSVLAALDEDGSVRMARLLGRLLLAPGDWVALARLARGFRQAQATLAGVVERTGPDLLAPV